MHEISNFNDLGRHCPGDHGAARLRLSVAIAVACIVGIIGIIGISQSQAQAQPGAARASAFFAAAQALVGQGRTPGMRDLSPYETGIVYAWYVKHFNLDQDIQRVRGPISLLRTKCYTETQDGWLRSIGCESDAEYEFLSAVDLGINEPDDLTTPDEVTFALQPLPGQNRQGLLLPAEVTEALYRKAQKAFLSLHTAPWPTPQDEQGWLRSSSPAEREWLRHMSPESYQCFWFTWAASLRLLVDEFSRCSDFSRDMLSTYDQMSGSARLQWWTGYIGKPEVQKELRRTAGRFEDGLRINSLASWSVFPVTTVTGPFGFPFCRETESGFAQIASMTSNLGLAAVLQSQGTCGSMLWDRRYMRAVVSQVVQAMAETSAQPRTRSHEYVCWGRVYPGVVTGSLLPPDYSEGCSPRYP